jgi:dihydroorotase
MKRIVRNARIVDAVQINAPQDILIHNGVIEAIGQNLQADDAEIWDLNGACISAGWLDFGTHTGDPGYEHREDLHTVSMAAAAGGFTALACFPNTHPAIHSKSEILYIKHKTSAEPVHFYPIGAISDSCAGKDLAELYDMHAAGAVAFSDGRYAVQDAGLLLRALQYSQAFNGLIINEPHHKTIASGGQAHEGTVSTMLGMKGIPDLAETIMVQRDLSLLEYASGRLHIHLLSTRKSVDMVRTAKKAGLPVTASVAIANLCFTDAVLLGDVPTELQPSAAFDSNWKLMPPLRSHDDCLALQEGLADGTIDVLCSNHLPWDEECKNLEYTYAEFGITGLETLFALYRSYLPASANLPLLVEKLAQRPRQILGIPMPEIKVGARAELTLFDPESAWVYEEKQIRSKAKNSPFVGKNLKGKVLGIIQGDQAVRV